MILSKEAIERLAGNLPFLIVFFKKNNKERRLYGKLDVSKYLKEKNEGDDTIYSPNKEHKPVRASFAKDNIHLYVRDLELPEKRGLRQANMEKVYMFVQGDIRIVDTEMERLFEQDRAYKEDEWRFVKENGSSTVTTRI